MAELSLGQVLGWTNASDRFFFESDTDHSKKVSAIRKIRKCVRPYSWLQITNGVHRWYLPPDRDIYSPAH